MLNAKDALSVCATKFLLDRFFFCWSFGLHQSLDDKDVRRFIIHFTGFSTAMQPWCNKTRNDSTNVGV